MEKEKEKLDCVKCSHKWKQRRKNPPKYCPCCHSPNWNKDPKYLERLLLG